MLFTQDARNKLKRKAHQISCIIIRDFNKKNASFSRLPHQSRQDIKDFIFAAASNISENLLRTLEKRNLKTIQNFNQPKKETD